MSNGNVKKIDDLGRIVIPRNIRKSLSIKKDDSLEIDVVNDSIVINKAVAVKKYANLFSNCAIKLLVTNRNHIIFNNTGIDNLKVENLINMSLYDLIQKKNEICDDCDIRPVIIDSNTEGIVIIYQSSCNEIVGELFKD